MLIYKIKNLKKKIIVLARKELKEIVKRKKSRYP